MLLANQVQEELCLETGGLAIFEILTSFRYQFIANGHFYDPQL